MVRFRVENKGKIFMQQLVNHLFEDAEWRMREDYGVCFIYIYTSPLIY